MQGYHVLALALLALAQVGACGEVSGIKDPTCFADIDGFPAITSTTSVSAETVLASLTPRVNTSSSGEQMPFGTKKFDACSQDSFSKLSLGSMKELFRLVDLRPKDSFVDLGSGLGEVPITAAVLSGVHHATGVELSKERHTSACEDLAKLQDELRGDSKSNSMVELMQGDMMKVDLSDDTVVFSNSYCFHRHLLDRLAEKLATELPDGARIASTKAFPELPPRLVKMSEAPLPLGDGVSVSIYEVSGPKPAKGQKRPFIRISRKQMKERAAIRKARRQALKERGMLHLKK